MGYKKPTYKHPPKFADANGKALPTKQISMATYLIPEIEAIAQEIHARKLAAGEIPNVEVAEKTSPATAATRAIGKSKPKSKVKAKEVRKD